MNKIYILILLFPFLTLQSQEWVDYNSPKSPIRVKKYKVTKIYFYLKIFQTFISLILIIKIIV